MVHCAVRQASKPRAACARHIEATGSAYRLPERGLLGDHAFYPAVLDTRARDDLRAQR
jgi:homogentisate 1,2-dioxygenase